MRGACIDIGSNATRLPVADVRGAARSSASLRIGEGALPCALGREEALG